MNKGTLIGLILLIGGMAIWAIYALILGAPKIMQVLSFSTVLVGGLIILGAILIFVSVVVDRYHEYNEMNEKIKKEDLEP